MLRKLAFALSLLGVCFTGFVQALGLGEANVKSALNQPLNAEIELLSAKGLESGEILPGLATREDFLKAKVDRVYFLSDLRFSVHKNSDGQMSINLTSKKPVREPFLNFLVEVIWPSGRLLREYSLLIDPPVFTQEKVKNVSLPQVQNQTSGDNLFVPLATEKTVADKIVNETKVASSRNPAHSLGNIPSNSAKGQYGPTDFKDTLWDIAIKARPNRTVSPQQVMLAIQDLNPNAFISGNINKLKAGQVLRLPTLEQIQQRNRSEAITEVISQNEALHGKRTKSIASANTSKNAQSASSIIAKQDELKLVVPDQQSNAHGSANSGQSDVQGNGRLQSKSDKQLALTLEKLDKATNDNSELSGRVDDLEEQLQTLQRLLILKNDQLSTIQTQMRANEIAKQKAENSSSQPELTNQVDQQSVDNTVPDNAGNLEKPVIGEQGSTLTVKDTSGQQDGVKEVSKEGLKKDKPVLLNEPVTPLQSEKSENLIESIVNNPLYLGLLVLTVLVLMGLLWILSKNNAKKEEEYQSKNLLDSYESDEDQEIEKFNEDDELVEVGNFEDDGLENEDEPSSIGDESNINSDEIEDSIAEADVYIAYGRLDQAAAVLESAISDDPVRTDYRLKLLSVYKESGDIDAFNRQFSELEAIQNSDAIEEATTIRNSLFENELVSIDGKEDELVTNRQIEEDLNEISNTDVELESEQESLENEVQSFDFDSVEIDDVTLDAELLDEGTVEESLQAEKLDDLDGAFELSIDEANIDEPENTFDPSEIDDAILDVELDVDLESDIEVSLEDVIEQDLEETTNSIEEEEVGAALSEEESNDTDLSDIDLSGELDQEAEISLEQSSVEENDDLEISDAILEEATEAFNDAESEDLLNEGLSDSEDFDFLNGTDEASTKLDLARAYIDMGDKEGAKDILQEVSKEGSDEQKKEANELLSTLDN